MAELPCQGKTDFTYGLINSIVKTQFRHKRDGLAERGLPTAGGVGLPTNSQKKNGGGGGNPAVEDH